VGGGGGRGRGGGGEARRERWGEVARTVWKGARRTAAEPKPTSRAIVSTEESVASSSSRARSTRCCSSHLWGVVPVSATKRRAKVRSDISARLASVGTRSEEHTSELQSRENLVCRLLLEKKK